MTTNVPDIRFRLPQTFALQPELAIDPGPANGLLIGQNAKGTADAIFLGKQAETPFKDVWMDIRGAHVLYVMGKRRSGKSYTLGAIAEGLVSSSWIRQGVPKPAVVVLDTMNVFLTMPFPVSDTLPNDHPSFLELKKWKLESEKVPMTLFAPAGTPPVEGVPIKTIGLRASDLDLDEWCSLFEIDPFVDPMGQLMGALLEKLRVEGYVDRVSGTHSPSTEHFVVTDMIRVLDVDSDLDRFASDTKDALGRRLAAAGRSPVFKNEGLDIRSIVRDGTVSVLLLRDLDPDMRAVMVSLVVKRIMKLRGISEQHERMLMIHEARAEKFKASDSARAEAELSLAKSCLENASKGLPRCWLIIDEAHNYIPARASVPSRKPLKKYVDEGRNLGLSIVVATQQPSGLDPSIQRNADMLLIHSLSHHDDIVAAEGMINTAAPDAIVVDGKSRISGARSFETVIRSLPLGYALVSTDRANRLFPIQIRPRISVHGGTNY